MFVFSFLVFIFLWGFLICFYLLSKEQSFSKEILWKGVYFLIVCLLIVSILFEYSENLLVFLTTMFKEYLILKDPQDLSILLYETVLFLASIFLILTLIFIAYTYTINAIFKQDLFALNFFTSLSIYFLILSFFYVNWDLFFSIRQLYNNLIYKNIDIQTDFYLLFLIYKGEFYDIFIYLFILNVLLFLFFKSSFVIKVVLLKEKYKIFLHRFLFVCISLGFLYFFGGDGFLSNSIIIFSTFLFFEFWVFLWYFLNIIAKKKFK